MPPATTGSAPATKVGRLRLVVFAIAAAATVVKLLIAANTFGTNDVRYWLEFARGVRDYGPFGLYGHEFEAPYNHPPMSGAMLWAINWLVDHGAGTFPFFLRVPASVADLFTALLVFELVRLGRPATEAAIAAGLAVCSPALFIISGFHGNTDPLFVMFLLLSIYLVQVRRWCAVAGLSFAAAVSVKLVPVVIGPLLLVFLIRLGWRRLAAFVCGCAALLLSLWGPVYLTRWPEFRENVLGYPGANVREWGLVQFAKWVGAPVSWTEFMVGSGRFVMLLLSAAVSVAIIWRCPNALGAAAGVSLAMFLLLSSAFGMQYLVWPLAAAYLVNCWAATVYNLAVSVFMLIVYCHWNAAYPWDWYMAEAAVFLPGEFVPMVVVWGMLAVVVAAGLRYWLGRGADRTGRAGNGNASPKLALSSAVGRIGPATPIGSLLARARRLGRISSPDPVTPHEFQAPSPVDGDPCHGVPGGINPTGHYGLDSPRLSASNRRGNHPRRRRSGRRLHLRQEVGPASGNLESTGHVPQQRPGIRRQPESDPPAGHTARPGHPGDGARRRRVHPGDVAADGRPVDPG